MASSKIRVYIPKVYADKIKEKAGKSASSISHGLGNIINDRVKKKPTNINLFWFKKEDCVPVTVYIFEEDKKAMDAYFENLMASRDVVIMSWLLDHFKIKPKVIR